VRGRRRGGDRSNDRSRVGRVGVHAQSRLHDGAGGILTTLGAAALAVRLARLGPAGTRRGDGGGTRTFGRGEGATGCVGVARSGTSACASTWRGNNAAAARAAATDTPIRLMDTSIDVSSAAAAIAPLTLWSVLLPPTGCRIGLGLGGTDGAATCSPAPSLLLLLLLLRDSSSPVSSMPSFVSITPAPTTTTSPAPVVAPARDEPRESKVRRGSSGLGALLLGCAAAAMRSPTARAFRSQLDSPAVSTSSSTVCPAAAAAAAAAAAPPCDGEFFSTGMVE